MTQLELRLPHTVWSSPVSTVFERVWFYATRSQRIRVDTLRWAGDKLAQFDLWEGAYVHYQAARLRELLT